MEDRIQTIHFILKELFPDAVSVNVLVSSRGIEVIPTFKTNLCDCSMKTITGKWTKKQI